MAAKLRRSDFFIGLYEPLIDQQIPYAIDQSAARTISQAKEFVAEFNEMACADPMITRLAGLFAYSAFPEVCPHVRRRQVNVKAKRGA
jgi:hypothetical protein